ncbi:hypothetical protein [Chachezhania antarctica]|uniref:hypothetical protein n=1 Tax=Chachezhania antarctica TaxID=2340860 RepID=UPI000EB437ED|nr:hypothetical protein [Chachezhania antarctica]|tara:strand:- start:34 stop:258 length:225 start_codon:yes stop_codon:yes gene_type:complete
MTDPATLDALLQDAHARHDKAALADLYGQAALGAGDGGQQAFFLTHAYVWALDAGLAQAEALKAQLISMGRETA